MPAERPLSRLARLAAKFRADIGMEELLAGLTADFGAIDPRHPLHRECQARFIDLDPPRRPPDMPTRRMRVCRAGSREGTLIRPRAYSNRSILAAMMKSFSWRPLILCVCNETAA